MGDPRWLADRARQWRHRYVEKYGSYHTVDPTPPQVWHRNPECSGGQQIPVENLRAGPGDRRRPCQKC